MHVMSGPFRSSFADAITFVLCPSMNVCFRVSPAADSCNVWMREYVNLCTYCARVCVHSVCVCACVCVCVCVCVCAQCVLISEVDLYTNIYYWNLRNCPD